jgi:hypothetical protein
MTKPIKIKYWWSEDHKWFCILVNDGINEATVSLTPEEASLLSMNAVLDETLRTVAQPSPGTEDDLALELEAWSRNLAGRPWSPWATETRIKLEKAAKALRSVVQSEREPISQDAQTISQTAAVIVKRLTDECAELRVRLAAQDTPIPSADLYECLSGCAQILDVVKGEWSAENAWSDWDQFVRDKITCVLTALAAPKP